MNVFDLQDEKNAVFWFRTAVVLLVVFVLAATATTTNLFGNGPSPVFFLIPLTGFALPFATVMACAPRVAHNKMPKPLMAVLFFASIMLPGIYFIVLALIGW